MEGGLTHASSGNLIKSRFFSVWIQLQQDLLRAILHLTEAMTLPNPYIGTRQCTYVTNLDDMQINRVGLSISHMPSSQLPLDLLLLRLGRKERHTVQIQ